MDVTDDSADRHIEARDILAHRKLNKTPLTPEEEMALKLLNGWLDERGIISWG